MLYIYTYSPFVTQRWQYRWCFRNLAGCISWMGKCLSHLCKSKNGFVYWTNLDSIINTHTINGTGIVTCLWLTFMVNLSKYTIHGSYGIDFLVHSCIKTNESSQMLDWATKKKRAFHYTGCLIGILVYNGLWYSPYIWVGFHLQGPFFSCSIDATGWFSLAFYAQSEKSVAQVMAIPLPENDTLKASESCFTKTHDLDMSCGFKLPFSQFLWLKSQVPKQNLVLATWRFSNSDMVIQHKTPPL